jgi:hypothetical protein
MAGTASGARPAISESGALYGALISTEIDGINIIDVCGTVPRPLAVGSNLDA